MTNFINQNYGTILVAVMVLAGLGIIGIFGYQARHICKSIKKRIKDSRTCY